MLRALVLILGLAALVGGIATMLAGVLPPALVCGAWGVLIVVGTLHERFRYKQPEAASPGPGTGWDRTAERFVDDETGRRVTVYVERRTGERKYVSE